jgi:hypothetical protein
MLFQEKLIQAICDQANGKHGWPNATIRKKRRQERTIQTLAISAQQTRSDPMLEENLTTATLPELTDPEAMFGLPENAMINSTLADESKIKALTLWKHDLMLLMTATDENMPARTSEPSYALGESTAEMLRRVSNVLLALDAGKPGPSHCT